MEMLQAAGVGVAMANGRAPLKAVADRVTERTNDDDGVAHALRAMERDGELHLPAPRATHISLMAYQRWID